MKNKILFPLLLLFGILVAFLGLNYSHGVNNFVFSNIINPYDHLDVQTSKPIKKDSLVDDYWKDPRGLFPIFAYNLPEKTNDLSASLKIIERSGINIIINSNMGWIVDAKKVKSAFENLKSSNLKWIALVENECKDDFIFRNANNETNSDIKKYLNEFNEDFIYGWYLWDEPGNNRKPCTLLNFVTNSDNADINRMSKQIRSDSIYNKKLEFVNLFPTYWDGTPSKEEYEKYIDAFISSQEFKPRVLCFDNYPLLKTEYGGFRNDYYSNLDIIRKKSIEYNIPFWMIVMASEHDYYKKPTFEEISLQVYSALAYGVKGIGYYLYARGWETLGYKSWILEDYVDNLNVADSLHGPLFIPVQNLNQNVQALGKILINLKSVEIIHTSDYPNKQKEITQSLFKSKKANSLIKQILNTVAPDTDSKLLIGIFEEKNKLNSNGKYLLIVNKDVRKGSNIRVEFNSFFNIFKFDKATGEKSILQQMISTPQQFRQVRVNYFILNNYCRELNMKIVLIFLFLFSSSGITQEYELDDSTISLWHFNESNGITVSDLSPNQANGTLEGNPQWVEGKFGSGVLLDGFDDFVSFQHDSVFNFGKDDSFSIEFWMKIISNNASDNKVIFSKQQDVLYSGSYGFIIWIDTNNILNARLTDDEIISQPLLGPVLDLNIWYNIVFVRSFGYPGRMKFFIDGIQFADIMDPTWRLQNSIPFLIGRAGREQGWETTCLNAVFDEIRISNVARLVTSITAQENAEINTFKLYQNFPNPFNPSTKISWQAPIAGWQILKVFDVLGNEVATLVDEYRNAGNYEIEFNASNLPSGVYFYQLKAGNYLKTKKMILIK